MEEEGKEEEEGESEQVSAFFVSSRDLLVSPKATRKVPFEVDQ